MTDLPAKIEEETEETEHEIEHAEEENKIRWTEQQTHNAGVVERLNKIESQLIEVMSRLPDKAPAPVEVSQVEIEQEAPGAEALVIAGEASPGGGAAPGDNRKQRRRKQFHLTRRKRAQ